MSKQILQLVQYLIMLTCCSIYGWGDQKPKATPFMDDELIVRRFTERLQEYLKVHKQQEASLPALKPTEDAEKIAAHQKALLEKIRLAWPHAERGYIFTPEVQQYFIVRIHNEFHGPVGHETRTTIKQGEPVKGRLTVNQSYPDGIPMTTVPSTLLLALPKLPQELKYGLVDRDLILLDVKANLVVDLILNAIPKS
jgi:hypothetical protein